MSHGSTSDSQTYLSRTLLDSSLTATLERTTAWLRFAEAKNAALGVAAAAVLAAVVQSLLHSPALQRIGHELSAGPEQFLARGLATLGVGGFLTLTVVLTSFLPWSRMPKPLRATPDTTSDNLLYFGDICKYEADEYLRKLTASLGTPDTELNRHAFYLAEQAIALSRITQLKLNRFTLGVSIFLVSLGLSMLLFALPQVFPQFSLFTQVPPPAP